MKLVFPCMKCSEIGIINLDFIEVELSNEGIYEATCNRGHSSITFTQEHIFEILFDMGGLALLDGYHRESVTSFAASLERFYEYCIEVMVLKSGVSYEEYEITWKLVNRSERQIGAFYLLYLNIFKEAPLSLEKEKVNKKNIIKFRNDVVHNGFIPTKQEVLEYGEKVFNYIISILEKIGEECKNEMMQVITKKQRKYYEQRQVNKRLSITTSSSPSMLGLSLDKKLSNQRNFLEALESLQRSISFRFKK